MNDNDTFTFEDRNYVSPTVSRDEQLDFIKTLREIQKNNYQRIETDTHNLGTDVTPNLGGLTGAGATWNNRYVKPQVDSTVAKLNAVAQETALNQSLENLKAQYKKRYNDAYRNAKNRAKTTGGGNGTTKDIPVNVTDDTRQGSGYLNGVPGAQSVVSPDGIIHDVYSDGTVKEYNGTVDERGKMEYIKDLGADYRLQAVDTGKVSGYAQSNPNHKYEIKSGSGKIYTIVASNEDAAKNWFNTHYMY